MLEKAKNGQYVLYNGNEYLAGEDYESGKIDMYSKNDQDVKLGFTEYAKGKYKKEVTKSELDSAYEVLTFVQYGGNKFQLDLIKDGEALLVHSGNPGNVEQLGFKWVEPYVFEKWVPVEALESVFEEKTPIWGF